MVNTTDVVLPSFDRLPADEPMEAEHLREEARIRRARRLHRADRLSAEVGRLRLKGWTFRQIADELGSSLGGVHLAWVRFRRTVVAAGLLDEEEIEEARHGQALVPDETGRAVELGS